MKSIYGSKGLIIKSFITSKISKVMRITLTLLLISTLQLIAGNSYSQSARLTLDLQNSSVENILNEIEQQSDFLFAFNYKLVDVDRQVAVQAKNKPISEVLTSVFAGTDVDYVVLDRQILLLPKNSVNEVKSKIQPISVSGIVTDRSGNPLPGVNIVIKGTTVGAISDANGNYSIIIEDSNTTLVFSFIGMITTDVLVGNQTEINVSLDQDAVGLEEVVAIGYGGVRKSDITGSLSQVTAEEIAAFPSLDMVQSLQGRAAGVQIQANNGEPGSSYKVRIRGGSSINSSSDPLYVVDGFPGATLPPSEDIQSIEVLKDASSTAIYGSRGANGVIMITTKRGKTGEAHIELNSSYSVQNEINRLDLLDKDQFTDYITEVDPGALDGALIGPGTDWQEEIFRPGQVQNHQLSISGGNEDLKYYVSGGLFDQEGVVLNSNYKRYSITSNVDIKATEKLKFGSNIFIRRSVRDGVRTQEGSSGSYSTGVISGALTAEPTLPVYDDDGNYGISWIGDPNDNPVAVAKERANEEVQDRVQLNFFGEYDIFKDLKFRVNLGSSMYNSRNGNYHPTTLLGGANVGGEGNISSNKNTAVINENYLTYSKVFGNHDITAMAGYSYQSTNSEYWNAAGTTFLTDAFLWWDLDGSSNYMMPSSSITQTRLSSFYGRLNYKLLDRFLFTGTARYDGSSRFAKNNKWAFFPSGAFAWNVIKEDFMQNVDLVSQLKLRASYGVTGNQAISPYQSLARFGTVHAIQNSEIVNAVRPRTVANDNLTWESTAQTDIGIDLGLFDHRVILIADYYNKKTTDLLFNLPLPEYSGYATMLKNIGSLQNRGVEFTLSTVNIDGQFRWTSDLIFSINRNKVLELPDGNDIFYRVMPGHMVGINTTNVLREGESVGSFYGYVYDGVYQEGETILPGNFDQFAGGEKYMDIDGVRDAEDNLTGEGDGQITGDDRTIIGDPNPDFIWSFNTDSSYKGFDLNLFFVGSQGNDLYSFTLMELETLRGIMNSTTEALDRWTPTHTNTDVPAASLARGYHESSRWIFDGSFVRLRNIALGYSLPKSLINSIGLENVRVYISGQNILTFTKYRGFDPEVNYRSSGSSSGNLNLGFDFGSYPNAKSFTLGLNVTF